MTRPLRIEYPNGWYHVMNRGRRFQDIFESHSDYHLFLRVLHDTVEQFGLRIAAYCLMPNHYHLLVQTPQANLSRCMRHINGVYTQRFNREHEIDGPLFRGRYKAVCVESDGHLLEVMRYIHNNPVKAGIAQEMKNYTWSSHHGYISKEEKWNWLHKQLLLDMLTTKKAEQKRRYIEFVGDNIPEATERFYSMKRLMSVFGGHSFKEQISILVKRLDPKEDIDPQAIKEFNVAPDAILHEVCNYYDIDKATLLYTRRGYSNLPRDVAIYLLRQHRLDTLKEIGVHFGLNKNSSVSSAIIRAKGAIEKDFRVQKSVAIISNRIHKSQKDTCPPL